MRNDAEVAEDGGCVRLACILVSFEAVFGKLWTLPKLAVVGNGFPRNCVSWGETDVFTNDAVFRWGSEFLFGLLLSGSDALYAPTR